MRLPIGADADYVLDLRLRLDAAANLGADGDDAARSAGRLLAVHWKLLPDTCWLKLTPSSAVQAALLLMSSLGRVSLMTTSEAVS